MTSILYRQYTVVPQPRYLSEREVWEAVVSIRSPQGVTQVHLAPEVYRAEGAAETRCFHYACNIIDREIERVSARRRA